MLIYSGGASGHASVGAGKNLHVLHILYIYIAYIFRSWEVWSCSCRRRTDLHVLQILNIYIYVLLIYSGGASGHASVGAGLIYMSCTYYIYIYIHCLYIQVMLLVMLLLAQDLFTCLAHIIYIYTLLVYSGEASGPATVGAGLIYMSCTYYIYIHCLYIQVMLLVMLLSAQDLFTCLAHIIYIYCLYIQVMLLVLLLSAQDLFTCLANLPHLYQ